MKPGRPIPAEPNKTLPARPGPRPGGVSPIGPPRSSGGGLGVFGLIPAAMLAAGAGIGEMIRQRGRFQAHIDVTDQDNLAANQLADDYEAGHF